MTKAADMLANMMRDQSTQPFTPAVIPTAKSLIIPSQKVPKKKKGRPTVMTPDNMRKIEEVASLGGNVEEMASFCDIHKDTIYAYMRENKDYSAKIERLQERTVLKARNTVVADLASVETSKWYLERKRRNEFSAKSDADVTVRTIQIDM